MPVRSRYCPQRPNDINELVLWSVIGKSEFSGIVYHANYLRFMKRGRTNYLRLLDVVTRPLEVRGTSITLHQEIKKRRGRPRAYEPDVALAKALDLFRKDGFAGTSLDDLSAATGMNRPSLYGAFGDKRAHDDDGGVRSGGRSRYSRDGAERVP